MVCTLYLARTPFTGINGSVVQNRDTMLIKAGSDISGCASRCKVLLEHEIRGQEREARVDL